MKLTFQEYISIKLHKTDLNLTSYVKAKLDPFDLAPEQNLIMMLLWEQDGLSQQQLVTKLDKDKTNIARMASSLEKKGFIKRSNCNIDRRSLKLYLTPCGKKLGEKVIPIAEEFNEVICKGISEEELQLMETLLEKMNQNVREYYN
jgi:DNA-binding MarR family transcriptional regulator